MGFIFGTSCRVGYGYWARGSGPWAVRASKKSARAISSVLHYAEAATDHELYYYTTMDELLHPETDEKLVLCDSIIFLRYARGSIRARGSAFDIASPNLNEKKSSGVLPAKMFSGRRKFFRGTLVRHLWVEASCNQ